MGPKHGRCLRNSAEQADSERRLDRGNGAAELPLSDRTVTHSTIHQGSPPTCANATRAAPIPRRDHPSRWLMGPGWDRIGPMNGAERAGLCTKNRGRRCDLGKRWWPGPGSNRRPSAFQMDETPRRTRSRWSQWTNAIELDVSARPPSGAFGGYPADERVPRKDAGIGADTSRRANSISRPIPVDGTRGGATDVASMRPW